MSDDIQIVSTTNKSKIVKYKLEEDVVNLRMSGMSYQQIADELNDSGRVPSDDPIDKWVIMRFLEKLPEINKQIVREDKRRLIQVVNNNMDIISEVGTLFATAKAILDDMIERAQESNGRIDPYRFKAISSEMREMLKQMTDIQREINDYNNVRKFMEVVLQVIREEAPDKIPIIVDRLKTTKGTNWFGDMMKKGADD